MIFQVVGNLHTSPLCRAAESSLLAKLRKKTGYTIANCKKALEMHSNDSEKELNLQTVRRTLIQTLEDFEAEDCRRCCHLKCRCEQPVPTQSGSANGSTPGQSLVGVTPPRSVSGSGKYPDALKSPPAIELPRPEFKTSSETNDPPTKDVESWVRASTPNPDKTDSPGSKPYAYLANFSWLPAPRSVWNDYKNKINKPEINTGTVSQAGNVQDFFKSFNANMYCIGSKHAHAQNRALMQKLKFMAGKQPEYSYF